MTGRSKIAEYVHGHDVLVQVKKKPRHTYHVPVGKAMYPSAGKVYVPKCRDIAWRRGGRGRIYGFLFPQSGSISNSTPPLKLATRASIFGFEHGWGGSQILGFEHEPPTPVEFRPRLVRKEVHNPGVGLAGLTLPHRARKIGACSHVSANKWHAPRGISCGTSCNSYHRHYS